MQIFVAAAIEQFWQQFGNNKITNTTKLTTKTSRVSPDAAGETEVMPGRYSLYFVQINIKFIGCRPCNVDETTLR